MENQEIPYSPYSIGKATKIDRTAVRKSLHSMLARPYLGIRRYKHPHRKEPERGLYVYLDPHKNPLRKYDKLKPGLHGIQIMIRNPRIKSANKRLDNKDQFIKIPPSRIIERLMNNDDLIPHLETRHKTEFKGVFAGRDVTITVHKKTKSIMIWLRTSDHSLDPHGFLIFKEWIVQRLGPIWKFSHPTVTQIGWNHDYFKVNIAGLNEITVQIFERKFQRVYNKGSNLRVETHSFETLSALHLVEVMSENIDEFDKIELSTQNRDLAEKIIDLQTIINDLRDENKGIVNNTTEIVDIFKSLIKPDHPRITNPDPVVFKPPDENDFSVV